MRKILYGIGSVLLAGVLACAQDKPNTLNKSEKKQGWRLLFDGKSLTGWEPHVGGDWKVEDGAIVCPGTSAGWLGTSDTFGDYVLKLEFRGGEKVNSGVFLRSSKEGQPHITGYELQIWDYQPAGYNTGSLVGSLKAAPTQILPGQWNRYEITAKGNHFKIVLNGTTLLEGDDAKHASGVVGFQCQKNNPIQFRSIRLQPVK